MNTTSATSRHTEKQTPVTRTKEKSTLGDLIVALTEETSRYIHNKAEVYRVVAYMITDLLCKSRQFSAKWH